MNNTDSLELIKYLGYSIGGLAMRVLEMDDETYHAWMNEQIQKVNESHSPYGYDEESRVFALQVIVILDLHRQYWKEKNSERKDGEGE